ncbi:MAG: hypothetical protein P8P74_16540 [Crocinitomicaceae bacterium]|nr:hypothetical protein [Crocinitomicaceae bacterium]
MKFILLRKKYLYTFSLLALLILSYGCQKYDYAPPGKLSVNSIFIVDAQHTPYLDDSQPIILLNHPNFDPSNPSTWTGDAAQYVIHRYTYTIQFHVTNSGKGTAYDAELDIGYFFDDGSDRFETFHIGDISSYGEKMKTVEIVVENKELEESAAEVYWYDY